MGVSLDMFIPSEINRTKYFRYKGSLTTPDCAEAVVWTLFESTIPLSRNQVSFPTSYWIYKEEDCNEFILEI